MIRSWSSRLIAGVVLAGWFAFAAPAGAHIQVRPTQAAPDDAVLFEVLVPDERQKATTKVEVAVPKDVLPFSFEDKPGWTRKNTLNPDGSIRTIVWRGRIGPGGLCPLHIPGLHPAQAGADRLEGHPDLRRRPEGALDRHPRQRTAGRRHTGQQDHGAPERRRGERQGRRDPCRSCCTCRDGQRDRHARSRTRHCRIGGGPGCAGDRPGHE